MTDSSEVAAQPGAWPDTTNRPPPQGYGVEAVAVWLLGRHPHLADLLVRADCVGDEPDDADLNPELMPYKLVGIHADLEGLAKDFAVFDRWQSRTFREEDAAIPPRAEMLQGMTPGEQCQLRLLATLTWGVKLCFEEHGFVALDSLGRDVLVDWLDALRAEWGTPAYTGSVEDPIRRPLRS